MDTMGINQYTVLIKFNNNRCEYRRLYAGSKDGARQLAELLIGNTGIVLDVG